MRLQEKAKLSGILQKYSGVGSTAIATTADAAFLGGLPGFTTLAGVATAHLGSSLKLKHKRAIELFDYIDKNRDIFTVKLMESEVFQDGFVYALERYLRLRTEEKRLGALLLFKSFAETEAKQDFPLERYFDTLEKISSDALRTLAFIKYEVIEPELKQINHGSMHKLDTISLFTKNPESGRPLSKLVSDAIHNKYLGMNKVQTRDFMALNQQERHTYMDERRTNFTKNNERLLDSIDELTYLGLIVQGSGSARKELSLDTTEPPSWWRLSNFATSFIEYIEKVGLDDNDHNSQSI